MSDREAIAAELAAALYEAEAALDLAFGATGRLIAMLPEKRVQAGLSAVVGQGVFAAATRAGSNLAEARAALVDSHSGLETVRRAMRLPPIQMTGPVDKPPVPAPVAATPLVRVA
jgi:hypothetical protein